MARGVRPSCAGRARREFPLVVFVLEIFFVLWGQRRRSARPPRFGSWRSNKARAARRRACDQPAVSQGQQSPQPRLRAHRGMKRPSQRDRAALVFFHERRVVVLDRRQFLFLRARTQAAGDQKCRDHGGEKNGSEHEAIDDAGRTEHDGGRAHQRVADDAAKPGRQRPCPAMRPAACKARRDDGAENPARDPQQPRGRRCDGSACASPTPPPAGSA